MSQTKAQLTNPVGVFTATGANISGVVTATTFVGNVTGNVTGNLTGNVTGNVSGNASGTSAGLSGTPNISVGTINATGVVTASSFVGDGSSLTNLSFGPSASVNTTGIITASKFVGDGSGLTSIGGSITALSFTPADGGTTTTLSQDITVLFNKPIFRNSGTITLRTDSASGTIVESFDVLGSTNISINAAELTINPSLNLVSNTSYYVVIPASSFVDYSGTTSNVVIDTYNFISTTVTTTNSLFVWGHNPYGELGLNDTTQRLSPTQLPGSQWSEIAIGINHTLALRDDGTMWAWGHNPHGQLGQNSTTQHNSPVQIPGNQWISIQADREGGHFNIAKKTDGTLWAWGHNPNGQLGLNDSIQRSSPVQIPGTQWQNISAGYYTAMATKSDGTLWTWGYNGYGQLGQGDTTQHSSPVQIPGITWQKISSGYNWAMGTREGALFTWGRNQHGELGLGDVTQRNSPTQVPGSQWAKGQIDATRHHAGVVKDDGTLWTWGHNPYGELGLNDTAQRSSPTQVPGTTWTQYTGGHVHSLGRKTDNTLWAWGHNAHGQLGQNNTTQYNSPVQIPGTTWTKLFPSGHVRSMAQKTS
jgi:alpha-tubulin suppressor-like RCC1 family protein